MSDALKKALAALEANDQWHKDHDDHDGYDGSDLQEQTGTAITALCAAIAQPPAPTAQPDPVNGIKATMFHDEGAIARCSYCWRYTLDPKALGDRTHLCDCGEAHGWSGSFSRPGPDATWSGKAPAAQPVQQPTAEPEHIAEVMPGWVLAWAGKEPIAHLLARHPGVRIGSKLYTQAAPAERQPLSDDADGVALRRAVANDLTVRLYSGTATAQSGRPGGPSAYETEADHSDPCAAARRAIHRAADIVEGHGISTAKGEKL